MAQAITYSQLRDIAETTTGDWLIGPSQSGTDLQLIGDAPALQQAVNDYLNSFTEEWFLNTADGIAWFTGVFVKNPNAAAINAIFRAGILAVDGIQSVTSMEVSIDRVTRSVAVTWAALGGVPVVPLGDTLVIQV